MALTVKGIAGLNKPGLYGDGKGLYLHVAAGGCKSWILRFQLAKRRRDMGLGPLNDVTLAAARDVATEARKLVRAGVDPIDQRRGIVAARIADAAKARTFDECAAAYLEVYRDGWRNAQHAQQWQSSIARYASPVFGGLPVDRIDTQAVISVLEPIWKEKPETADRVRGRIEAVLNFATTRGHRPAGDNPARWAGHLEHTFKKRKAKERVHYAAIPYTELPEFMAALRGIDGVSARAFEFTILNAMRTSEVLGARWQEFDLEERVWTVTAERMKAEREHRVPLSDAAYAIVESMAAIRTSDFVFPGSKPGRPLGHSALRERLKDLRRGITPHGMRSAFSDWCAERTAFSGEVREMALAHVIPNKAEAAYRRGDLFDKRRQLMDAWAHYCMANPAKLVPLPG